MEYRAKVRRTPGGFDAWTPELDGCAAHGRTEAEALSHLRHAIEGRLDLERMQPADTGALDRSVSVELPEAKLAKSSRLAAIEPAPASPVPPVLSFTVGATLFGTGLTGIFAFIMVEPTTSPVVFFASAVLAAMGAGGIVMGLITMESRRKTLS